MPSLPRLLALAASLAVAAPALAQTYPSKPVKIMVPFAAGGIADITTRFVADRLSTKLGQQFVVENKAGPGGIDAARAIELLSAAGETVHRIGRIDAHEGEPDARPDPLVSLVINDSLPLLGSAGHLHDAGDTLA